MQMCPSCPCTLQNQDVLLTFQFCCGPGYREGTCGTYALLPEPQSCVSGNDPDLPQEGNCPQRNVEALDVGPLSQLGYCGDHHLPDIYRAGSSEPLPFAVRYGCSHKVFLLLFLRRSELVCRCRNYVHDVDCVSCFQGVPCSLQEF